MMLAVIPIESWVSPTTPDTVRNRTARRIRSSFDIVVYVMESMKLKLPAVAVVVAVNISCERKNPEGPKAEPC